MGDLDPYLIHDSLGPSEPITCKRHIDWSSRFCTAHRSVPLHWAALPICPILWGIWTHMVPWARPNPQPNGISIGSAVFAGLTTVTDRQTILLG